MSDFRNLVEGTIGVGKDIISGSPEDMHKKIINHKNLGNIAITSGEKLLPETIHHIMESDDVDFRLKQQLCLLKSTKASDVNHIAETIIQNKIKTHPYLALGIICNSKLSDANREAMKEHTKARFE